MGGGRGMVYAIKVRFHGVHFRRPRYESELAFGDLVGLGVAHFAVVVAVADGLVPVSALGGSANGDGGRGGCTVYAGSPV